MIPAERKEEIIASGINFMRSITEAYGSEVGMELWDTISSTLDPDVKGQIFFTMLTGEYGNKITIRSIPAHAGKVAIIKAVRELTGLGLKEAKDLVDIGMPSGTWDYNTGKNVPPTTKGSPFTIKINASSTRQSAIKKLRDLECVV